MRATRDEGYIWNVLSRSDAAALSSTGASSQKKFKQKGNERDVKKKGTGLEGASGLFLVHLGPNADSVWAAEAKLDVAAGVCHYLLFEKKKKPKQDRWHGE